VHPARRVDRHIAWGGATRRVHRARRGNDPGRGERTQNRERRVLFLMRPRCRRLAHYDPVTAQHGSDGRYGTTIVADWETSSLTGALTYGNLCTLTITTTPAARVRLVRMNVLILDGHPMVHEVLGKIVRAAFGPVCVRTATTLDDVLQFGVAAIDMALLDLALPDCAGIEALRRFRGLCPTARVVVISADRSPSTIVAALSAGASGYLPKTLTPKVMSAAIRLIGAGGVYVPFEALGDVRVALDRTFDDGKSSATHGLTDRQLEVLRLIRRGYNNRTIARQLSIAEGTVKQHVHAMFGALRVSSRTEAIAAATRLGLNAE